MSNEKHNFQHQADRAKTRHKRSVFNYLLLLFSAAIILLLFAHLMQQRSTSEQALSGLLQSVSAMQSAQELYEENGTLKETINALESTVNQLEGQIGLMQGTIDAQSSQNKSLQQQTTDLEKSNQAMDWFWQINEAYVRGRHNLCKDLITQLNSAGLAEYLPRNSITANNRFSPYDRYQEIYDALY